MKNISRRRLLAAGFLARTATLAGCLGRQTEEGSSPTSTGTDEQQTAGGGSSETASETTPTETTPPATPDDVTVEADAVVVRFPDVADGAVSVGERRIRYTDPVDATFQYGGVWNDRLVSGDGPPLVVSRTIDPDGPPTAFVAPVYRDAAGFEYRIYVNAAFRDAFDWRVLAASGSLVEDGDHLDRPAVFEDHAAGVYRDVVRPAAVPDARADEPLTVVLANYSADVLVDRRPDDAAAVALESEGDETSTPEA